MVTNEHISLTWPVQHCKVCEVMISPIEARDCDGMCEDCAIEKDETSCEMASIKEAAGDTR